MVGLSVSHYFSSRGMRPALGFDDWPLAHSLDSQPNELPRLTLSIKPLELLLKSQGGISNVIFALDLRKRTLTILRIPCSTSLCWGWGVRVGVGAGCSLIPETTYLGSTLLANSYKQHLNNQSWNKSSIIATIQNMFICLPNYTSYHQQFFFALTTSALLSRLLGDKISQF